DHQIKRSGLSARVTLQPYHEGWWQLLGEGDALVSMSRFEGQPNVVLEAMAAGCPVIVSSIPAHQELLDERSARFVAVNDAAALAQAITELSADPHTASRRAQEARAVVESQSAEVICDRYLQAYEWALGRQHLKIP